ncbi:SGNH/GDSL hydrolase family protein [Mucilaginibacter sp. BT774]|uniref:SGNH/GDSL hydrolase family protein n=1 Tax=Mucilaginibacter sp. BT774 TaxID=3062276 RepID=UPI002674507C|nr:SGNH/GDSL hydrolase family protein [Mucilaginibacter sp. BT774]MDO3624728.1 SGNH/GDSL hydrolase family protein [Mucilaginibacter sp. BT774]
MKKYLILLVIILLSFSFTGRKIVWVAIGDSITYLNDHPDETANRVTRGYLSRVADTLPDVQYINQGHNGWKSTDIAAKIDQLGLIKADVYSIFLGTNDWWGGIPAGSIDDYKNATGTGTVYGSFRKIIDKVRRLNDQAKIILITPMQRSDFVYVLDPNNNAYGSYKTKNGQSLEDVANAVISIGKYEHLAVIDLYHDPRFDIKNMVSFKRLKDPQSGKYTDFPYPQSTTIPFNAKTDEYPYPPAAINMTYDGLHPSDKGDSVIARMLVDAFGKLGLAARGGK